MRVIPRFALALALVGHTALAAQEDTLLVRGGRLFDGVDDAPVANPGILVRGGKFLAIGGIEETASEGAEVLELDESDTILPGFFDLHAHYGVDLFGLGRVDERAAYPAIFLANGVTSTFPAGEQDPEAMRELRMAIDRGERPGPRVFNSGPYFGTARRGWNRRTTPDEIRAEVDHWAERGVRGFKAKGIGPEQLRALIERAHLHGLTVTGHLESGFRGSVNPKDAIAMGIDRVEHFLGGDALPPDRPAYDALVHFEPGTPEFADIARRYIEGGVYFDATLTAYGYFGKQDPEVYTPFADERAFFTPYMRAILEERPARRPIEQFETIYWIKRPLLRAFHDAGGAHLITLGTDHPSWGDYLSGFCVHRELHCLRLAGLPAASVLKAATINAARALGAGDLLGSIEAGKLADLVVVAGDPFADMRATRHVRHVVKAGRLYDPAALLEAVKGTIGPKSEEEQAAWQPGR